ncbi:MAG: cytochrome c oxidase accessory protein CcoG [Lewinellaceae bacterium]|nr:cytochrome c oxidase accessory protein CcoG [Saprospiraceae bacterium]MCB9339975.1 cytochrome c oxidase accessory protein CcoG [Lewinellaceae bacterium]
MNDIEQLYQDSETFRDHLATVDKKGKRIWIYPKKPAGWFYKVRTYTSWLLLAILIGMPFIKINGEPFMLFNVLEGKFILFGIVFTPQDLHLFALAMVTLMVFIVLFTVVFGRLFCGWVCPQTIFMEMVFRKIEYWIEGDANQQRKLDKEPWTSDKIIKKGSKHIIFFLIAVLIANIFLTYIIGVDQVGKIISEPINMHVVGFAAMLIFSGLFYGVFAFMREQVCTTICPYGRMQGVLLVPDSIVVHYDFVRGEPRGKIKKTNPVSDIQQEVAQAALKSANGQDTIAESPIKILGDCIDCKLCVQVCPTGIDIRNGTQLECVNCTACIDACDGVMDKVSRPRGLIRYDSYNGIQKGKRHLLNTRVIAYSAVLVILIVFQAFLLGTRNSVETLVLKTPGQLYNVVDDIYYRNVYNWEVINKTAEDIQNIEFKLVGVPGSRLEVVGTKENIISPKQGLAKGVMMLDIPKTAMKTTKRKIKIEVYSNGKLIDEATTNFLGPIK